MTEATKTVARRQGSIIERRGKKGTTYKLKFDLPGMTAGGKRRTVYKTVKASTRKEAERALRKLFGEAENGVQIDGAKQSVAEWIGTWLQDHIRHDVTTRTFERYGELLRHHVVPHIGHHPLRVLAPMQIERLYNTLAESGWRHRTKSADDAPSPAPQPKGLAPRTVNHIHRVLFECLKDAARLRLIDRNPASDVKRRKLKKTAATATNANAPAVIMKILDRDDLGRLFSGIEARGTKVKSLTYPLVFLAVDSGARRGELLALRWTDLDLDRRTLRIDRAVDETKTNGVVIKPDLKNASSRRVVTISTRTADLLRAEWKRQVEDQLKLGRRLPADALIFPNSPEDPALPLRPREVTKAFSRAVKAIGLTGLRFHDLRHNCASHMLANGRSIPDVAKHLGHSTPAITMAVYAHAIPEKHTGAGLLDDLLPALAARDTRPPAAGEAAI